MPAFTGFPAGTLQFLAELEANNDRDWFESNRDRYESLVREPALDFVSSMDAPLQRISEHLTAVPKKAGGSLMRVHRDVRFSKDKTPYKTNIGIQFRHARGKDVHAPGFYLHIDNTGCFLAAGVWRPEREALAAIRERIRDRPGAWKKVTGNRAFSGTFTFGGESLTRPPRGFEPDDPNIEDLKRKDYIASTTFPAGDIEQAGFLKQAASTFAKARPLMQFICDALQIEF